MPPPPLLPWKMVISDPGFHCYDQLCALVMYVLRLNKMLSIQHTTQHSTTGRQHSDI